MIKSRKIRMVSTEDDTKEVLKEAESFAQEMHYSRKDALHFRLLAEETMAMLRSMTGEVECSIEFIGNKDHSILNVETDTLMNPLKKEDLLSVSSSGKNISAKGIMGKIRSVLEAAFTMPAGGEWMDYCPSTMVTGFSGDVASLELMDSVYWSLNSYRKEVGDSAPEHQEAWDELEKSIVSNIADDVQVGVRGGHVVMSIIYRNAE